MKGYVEGDVVECGGGIWGLGGRWGGRGIVLSEHALHLLDQGEEICDLGGAEVRHAWDVAERDDEHVTG